MNEHLQYLVQKHFEGKLTIKENIEFSELLADQKNLEVEHLLDDTWRLQLNSEAFPDRNLTSVLDKVHHHIRLNENIKPKLLTWGQSFQRVAAILIIPLLLSFVAYSYFQNKKTANIISYAEIQCPLGVRVKFQLPDGSTGFLNSGSKLKYPVVFSKQRTVDLTGEAYFDVVHNEDIPFHVNTRNLDIKVLGTQFDVSAYSDGSVTEVVLKEGKVEIKGKSGVFAQTLLPGEKITFDPLTNSLNVKKVDPKLYSAWTNGYLVIDNERLGLAVRKIERWYNAEISIQDEGLKNFRFRATFSDEPLEEVLRFISMTTPITYKIEKRDFDSNGVLKKRQVTIRLK